MSKPWEIKLTEDQLYRFEEILNDLKSKGTSSVCPFTPYLCNRPKPTCANFIKGLRRIDHSTETACPCHKFRTISLIWRIEKLLEYNK